MTTPIGKYMRVHGKGVCKVVSTPDGRGRVVVKDMVTGHWRLVLESSLMLPRRNSCEDPIVVIPKPLPHPRGAPDPTDRDLEAIRLFETGLTLRQVGDKFGITRERVRQVVGRWGYDGEKRDLAKEERKRKRRDKYLPQIREMRRRMKSIHDIAKTIPLGHQDVSKVIKENGMDPHLSGFQGRDISLTVEEVAEIKAILSVPNRDRVVTWKEIAGHYGVTLGMLGHINVGRSRSYVEAGELPEWYLDRVPAESDH